MNSRSIRMIVAASLVALVSTPAFAQVTVRMKNVGVQAVRVNAKSGLHNPVGLQAGSRVLAANGVTGFRVNKGTFTAMSSKPSQPTAQTRKVRQFNTRNFKTVYLEAQADATAATLVGAPAGVKF